MSSSKNTEEKKQGLWKKSGSNTVATIIGWNSIKDGASYMIETGAYLFNPKKAIANARNETFEEAVKRHGVTDEDLKKNYNNFVITFYVSALFALVCLGLAFNYLFNEQSIMGGLSSLSIMSVCLANCFKYSFRAFQIKHRSLCSVKDFTPRVKEWFPRFA